MAEPKTYYLVKYALSDGVAKTTGEPTYSGDGWIKLKGYSFGIFKLGRDVTETEEEAAKLFEQARIKKIASLRKQVAKLEKLTFKVRS